MNLYAHILCDMIGHDSFSPEKSKKLLRMSLIKVSIRDEGEHWHKTVKLFGLTVYHRHDFTKEPEKRSRTVGFNVMPSDPVEIEDEEYYPKKVNVKAESNEQI